jgi:hypothetical protein
MRNRSTILALLATAVLLTSVASDCPRRYELRAPVARRLPDASAVQRALQADSFAPAPRPQSAVGIVLPIPATSETERLVSIRQVPLSGLPPAALLPRRPSEALGEPGLYVGLFEGEGPAARGVYYVARISDPRLLIGESGSGDAGRILGRLVRARQGVIAVRVPFVARSESVVFEVDQQGDVSEVLASLPLGAEAPYVDVDRNRVRVRTR